MTRSQPFQAVFELESRLGASWRHIRSGYDETVRLHRQLSDAVGGEARDDAAIVVLGSVGRFEVTADSDIDWTYLVDGQADVKHQAAAIAIAARIASIGKKKPGREGIFGNVAFSHGLIQYIGGQDDTNANLTRRILLLSESKAIGRRDAYDRVIRGLLDRYLSGDDGWMHQRTPHGVPRFLQNDIARYWRTVAVDFAYKQWTRDNEGWGLKNAKLRFSRKLTYAGGLLYCFSLAEGFWESAATPGPARKLAAIEHLWELTNSTPLDLLADAFLKAPSLLDSARATFDAYDAFLALLGDAEKRKQLEALHPDDADSHALFGDVRRLGRAFQDGLTTLFFKDRSTKYPELVEVYGVF